MNTNFDDFLERVRKYEDKKVKVTVINIEDFGELEAQRPSANAMLKYQKEVLSAVNDIEINEKNAEDTVKEKIKFNTSNVDYEKFARASSAFVYNSCSALREKAVREMYPNLAFEDIPLNLFGENNIIGIASQIYNAFNVKKEVENTVETIKN